MHARHADDAVLQRLTERLQRVPAEFRQLIEEQNAYTTVSSLHEPFPPNVSANETSTLTPL